MTGAAADAHVPVLLDPIVALFADAPEGVIVDATLGAGGHALAVTEARLARPGRATLVGLDRDPHALALAGRRLAGLEADPRVAVHLVRTRFDAMPAVLDQLGIAGVAGVLLDLGISSMHVDQAARGFSYRQDGPLDMRMDPDTATTAADLVNGLEARALIDLLRRYADERFASRIAHAIVAARPITSTVQLADVVRDAIPHAARRTGGHPATRTFQALRIAVNGEIDALEALLPEIVARLLPGGVAAVLSYHSLEDRPVKQAFAAATRGCICPPDLPVCACGREPLATDAIRRSMTPDAEEVARNPRASSARLRAIRRTEVPLPTDANAHVTDPDPSRRPGASGRSSRR
ncbi:MAG: 16S rRNA (cytosine(1402)-N(4))-methyltransferase RsmH [Nitriliruptoraceae bacterium]|nr:16S rRNA (cytosine(1402)-N(4))-methyltransferase RsmH [Nitriliruptoraceae bacterium]